MGHPLKTVLNPVADRISVSSVAATFDQKENSFKGDFDKKQTLENC